MLFVFNLMDLRIALFSAGEYVIYFTKVILILTSYVGGGRSIKRFGRIEGFSRKHQFREK